MESELALAAVPGAAAREVVPAGSGGSAVTAGADGGLVLPGDVESVGRYLSAAKAESTRKAYDADFGAWSGWARERGFTPMPAADAAVAAYLAAPRGGRRPKKARALDTQTIRALVEALPEGVAGLRDRALILTSFALGLRASDACGLDVTDLAPAGHGGLDVTVRWSKTDQEGAGEVLALAPGMRAQTCPVRALEAWVEAADLG